MNTEGKIKDLIERYLMQIKNNTRNFLSFNIRKNEESKLWFLMSILEWEMFDSEEVDKEFLSEPVRIDYTLKLESKNSILLSIYKPREILDHNLKPFLSSCSQRKVDFGVLTNGIIWRFFLSNKVDSDIYEEFLTADILHDDLESTSQSFIEYLSKKNVSSGSAYKAAEIIFKSRGKRQALLQTLPKAWNELMKRPDSLLINLLAEKTQTLCGFRPENYEVEDFIFSNQNRLILGSASQPVMIEKKPEPDTKTAPHRGKGRIAISVDEQIFEAAGTQTLFMNVLKFVVDNGSINQLSLPWGTGAKRYIIYQGDNPMHPHHRFFTPVSYKNYHLEAHVSRLQGIKNLTAFLTKLEYKVEIIEV